jgi:hypothetical protein
MQQITQRTQQQAKEKYDKLLQTALEQYVKRMFVFIEFSMTVLIVEKNGKRGL